MAVIKIVRFRLAGEADTSAFLRGNERVEREDISRQPGFISRELAQSDDGE